MSSDSTKNHVAEPCPECGAAYTTDGDSCSARFNALLALDHSHQEPWGSRHGQAFAAFALQHPGFHAASLDRAWEVLHRIYLGRESPARVFGELVARRGSSRGAQGIPPRPPAPVRGPDLTIVDMADFDPATYPERLDAWCRAALAMWGAKVTPPFLEGPPDCPLLRDVGAVTALLEACFAVPTRRALLYAENLPPGFFDVSSGVAGEFLQKLRTYGLRVAVVAPAESVPMSHRFQELMAAERRDRAFDVFDAREPALLWLAE